MLGFVEIRTIYLLRDVRQALPPFLKEDGGGFLGFVENTRSMLTEIVIDGC